jgi:hypothetical protein
MKKEYMRVVFSLARAVDHLNELAAQGWRIINIHETNSNVYAWLECDIAEKELLKEEYRSIADITA